MKKRAADILGISLKTLYNRLEEYGPYEGPLGNQAVAPKWGEAHDGVMLITDLRLPASVAPVAQLIGRDLGLRASVTDRQYSDLPSPSTLFQ